MRRARLVSLLSAFMLALSVPRIAVAQIGGGFVNATTLFCRSAPIQSAPIVTQLPNRTPVTILERSGEWVRVTAAAAPSCWVMEQFLSAGRGGASRATVAPRSVPSAGNIARTTPARSGQPLGLSSSAPLRRAVERATRPARVSAGGACPCSSSRNCIGPRGGRYCVTGGGNRRYR